MEKTYMFILFSILLAGGVAAEILEGGAFKIIPSVGGGGNLSGGAFNVITSIKGRLIYNSTLPQGLNLPPTFTNPINASIDFKKWSNFTANITVIDNSGLNYSIFSINMSGTWVNDTPVPLNGLMSFRLNTTKNITVGSPNTTCWKVFANDSSGLMGESSIYCFEVVAEMVIVPPGGSTGGGGGGYETPPRGFVSCPISYVNLNQYRTSYIHRSDNNPSPEQIVDFTVFSSNYSSNQTLTFYYSTDNKRSFNNISMHYDNETDSFVAQLGNYTPKTTVFYYVNGRCLSNTNRTPEKGYDVLLWDYPFMDILTQQVEDELNVIRGSTCEANNLISRLLIKDNTKTAIILALLCLSLLMVVLSKKGLYDSKRENIKKICMYFVIVLCAIGIYYLLINSKEFSCLNYGKQLLFFIYFAIFFLLLLIVYSFKIAKKRRVIPVMK